VITVTFNDLAGLKVTYSSLIAQTGLEGVEWIVVDGGSSDGTLRYLDELTSNSKARIPIRVLLGPDRGIAHGMNRGAEVASGRFLQFLNAGDRLHDASTLRDVRERLARDTDTRWAYGFAQVVDADYRPSRPIRRDAYSRLGHAYHRVRIYHQAVFMRRDLHEQLGGFDEGPGLAFDYELLVRAGRQAMPSLLDAVLVDYVEGGASQVHFASRVWQIGQIRRQHLGMGRVARLVDRLFTVGYIAVGRTRAVAKRTAARIFGPRIVSWWAKR
jgi:glycosyltransferase involved in cell wall biosynthesis